MPGGTSGFASKAKRFGMRPAHPKGLKTAQFGSGDDPHVLFSLLKDAKRGRGGPTIGGSIEYQTYISRNSSTAGEFGCDFQWTCCGPAPGPCQVCHHLVSDVQAQAVTEVTEVTGGAKGLTLGPHGLRCLQRSGRLAQHQGAQELQQGVHQTRDTMAS